MSAGFWLFCCCFYCFFVFFCMIWSNIIIFSPPEHKKHHLNLKWGDLIFWFRPISCTHFATPQHVWAPIANIENEIHVICPSKKKLKKKYYSPLTFTCLKHCLSHVNPLAMLLPEQITEVSELHKRLRT